MNLDEETFLTAYLDGELEPEQRLRVDAAVLADPGLFEDFRALTAVRDLVSGLPSPAPGVDVSSSVVATIRRRRAAALAMSSWSARAATLLTSAAALIVVASLGVRLDPPADGPDLFAVAPSVPGQVPETPGLADPDDTPRVASSLPEEAGSSTPGPEERAREQEARGVQQLLESPNLRKVFVVGDVIGGGADREVSSILETTPRRNPAFGRLTVSQGIFIDPDHPGEATVFAVVMDAAELAEFRARLDKTFPERVTESAPDPELVTGLSEIGQVSVFPGTLVAGLIDPTDRPRAALKARKDTRAPAGDVHVFRESPGVDPLRDSVGMPAEHDARVLDTERLLLGRRRASRPVAAGPSVPAAAETTPEPVVVLVWVPSPRRPETGVR